jgi:hypothetical protein
MAQDGPAGSRQAQRDVVSFGAERRRRIRLPRWLPLVLAAAVLSTLAGVAIAGRGRQPSAVTITDVGHPLLGETGDWQLFGLGWGQVVQIQLARGRVIRTAVPGLAAGPAAFLVGPDQVIIRPLDNVPGYAIPDGLPARGLRRALSRGSLAVPGPQPGQVWISSGRLPHLRMSLVSWDGSTTGISVPVPGYVPWLPVPDGRGFFLFHGPAGTYDSGPGHPRLVTSATVVAVGPASWLGVQCSRGGHCSNVVISPATGGQRTLPGPPVYPGFPADGVTSPDGSMAAAFDISRSGHATLRLLSLASGADYRVAIPPGQEPQSGQALAWSPDSRWLFVATADGRLLAVNARTRQVGGLGVTLPRLSEIAVRSTAT